MIAKSCRLVRASKYFLGGGGGGGSDVQMRDPKSEQKSVGNWYNFQFDRLGNFIEDNPLLGAAQKGALGFWNQLPQMLAQFPGFQKELTGYQGDISGYQGQLGDISQQLRGIGMGLPSTFQGYQKQLGGLYNQLGQQSNQLGSWLTQVQPTISSHGALTPQMSRDVSQQTRAIAAAQGNAHSLGTLGNELLNRDAYREQRFNQALQQGQGLLGQQSGIFGQQAGITGQRAGLSQALAQLQSGILGQRGGLAQAGAGLSAMNAGLTGQKAGLLGQQQALQTGGLNQLLGVGNAAVSQFGGLTNPVLSYLGNLFGGNQQASIAQAQIAAQQSAAGDAKMGSTIGGGISAIGSIAALAL